MNFPYDPADLEVALNDMRAEIQSLLISVGTDLDLAANEPYGNGDQSIIVDPKDRDRGRELFGTGADIGLTANANAFSSFAVHCINGQFDRVRSLLEEVCEGLPQPFWKQEHLRKLLESRETSLRLPPLLLILSAGKFVPVKGQSKIAKLLLRYGASPDAKDALGKTAVHYGAGAMATPMSMEVAGMCIEAAETSDMFGKSAELEGLQNVDMNGQKGWVGGYDVDSGRRSVYIVELKKELWVKPSNIRIITKEVDLDSTCNLSGREAVLKGFKTRSINGKEGILGVYNRKEGRRAVYVPELKKQMWVKPENIQLSETKLKLPDVRDRFGSVSLHEVVMSNRADVAEFLLKKYATNIRTMEAEGVTPIFMTMSGGRMVSPEVSQMIADVARAEAAAHRKEVKQSPKENFCECCDKSLGTGGMQCAKCRVTFYCDRECQVKDWKEGGHKHSCKKIVAQEPGVKFIAQHCEQEIGTVVSFATGVEGENNSFRKPQSIKFDQKFVVKVQANNDSHPMMIYDETRQCQFRYMPTGPGFREVFEAVQNEPTWNGRKTFMKASFNEAGECTMYPATAGVKNKYSW